MVAKPEVYKSANSDCYIVFGDVRYPYTQSPNLSVSLTLPVRTVQAKLEDPNSAGFGAQAIAAAQAAEARQKAEQERQAKSAGGRSGGAIDPFEGVSGESSGTKKDDEPEADDADVDTTGLEEEDIQTVMRQSNCSKAKAVKALKDSDGVCLSFAIL